MDEKIRTWIREVRRFNPRLHLVSRSMESTLREQAEDTLSLLERIHEPAIADLGSGSGLLAVLYKTAHPDSHLWMIERSQKKALFLRHIVDVLDLDETDLLDYDPLQRPAGPFPAVMSRSFSPRETLVQIVTTVMSRPGRFYYLSTGEPETIEDPAFSPLERFTRECRNYRLNLEVYGITSR